MTPEEFWQHVEKSPDPGGCWLWTGKRDSQGYGHACLTRGQYQGAYRIAYELVVGPIPRRMQIDHLCRVHACVNPAHLEPVTQAENMRRAAPFMPRGKTHRLGARTHCKRGHEFTDENTRWYGASRVCRECEREVQARAARRKRTRVVNCA